MIQENQISYADQEYIDACKKRLGANPKPLTQLKEEGNWDALRDNFWKLRDAQRSMAAGVLVLINGAEL